ncbi:uncharacterized protein [Palaemon carinicauda]|uniref:uncharacterized protein n=1 Tax=Palaemon carinicauda TaxID=392227 RepID=UPI0035B5B302
MIRPDTRHLWQTVSSMIREGSDKKEWRNVNSEWNPADDATRSKQSERQLLIELDMHLSTEIISLAETVVVQVTQRVDYEIDIESLEKGGTIRASSSLRRLKPILRNGLLCVGGRLSSANISPSERHPIILLYKGHLTDMVIQYYYEHSNHMGVMHVLSLMREKFWVIKGHAAVRRVLSRCVRCRRAHGKIIEQLMADLPPDRVESGKTPSYCTGVDLFGPFFVKRGRRQMKHWGVIFTCLNMRAIHVEVAFKSHIRLIH